MREASEPREIDENGLPIEYQAWTPGSTRVVSGPVEKFNYPGRPFPNRAAARAFWSERADIVEQYMVEGRWVLRIRKAPLRAPLPPFEERVRTTFDTKRFVKEWELAPNLATVAKRMGMKANTATMWALRLRKLGVKLKSFHNQRGVEVDVAALNEIVSSVQ